MSTPEIIGLLHGAAVLIDRDTKEVMIAHDDFGTIKFSVDHPYIQGTKLERDARKAMKIAELARDIDSHHTWAIGMSHAEVM